jgi:hypothetical protein
MFMQEIEKGRVIFEEDKHLYYYELDDIQQPLTSMTTVLKLVVKTDFTKVAKDYFLKYKSKDDDFLSLYMDVAKKNKLNLENTIKMCEGVELNSYKDVMKIWDIIRDKAALKGTIYHKRKEDESYDRGCHPIKMDGSKKVSYGMSGLSGNYSELIVHNLFYKICGTADVVNFDGNKFSVRDYKTSKEKPIESSSFKGDKMSSPVNHLLKNDYWKFALQLSGYAFMLEEYGYECNGLAVDWVKDVEKDIIEEVKLPYLKKEAKALFEYHKSLNKK